MKLRMRAENLISCCPMANMDGGAIIWDVFLLFILIALVIPWLRRRSQDGARLRLIQKLERDRNSRIITLIHRQETMSFLGFPVMRYIDIDDSEHILRAIRMTPDDMPIDIVLHTPGGLVLAAEQIALALKKHEAKVTVIVPHYAMSGGTLLALAADEIVMDENAVLGPVDPQIGNYPAASILRVLDQKEKGRIRDETLILADISEKAIGQVNDFVFSLLKDKMGEDKAREITNTLTCGRWTHDYPITLEQAKEMGLPVTSPPPADVYALMDLYPQPGGQRPSVEYIPMPYRQRGRR
jgi:ClpP class serine protease